VNRKRAYEVVSCGLLVIWGVCADVVSGEELRRRGMMGVMLGPVNEEAKERLKLDAAKGVLVTSTVPGSAAAEAGIQGNDVIRKIGPDAVDDIPALMTTMRKYYGGDTLKLTVIREGAEKTFDLTLRPRPKETSEEYEVIYDYAGEPGQRVRTLITRPKGEGKKPAVLIVTPITSQAMEMTFPNPHPVKSLLQEFNKAGYVTMRVDRPGVGDSEGTDLMSSTVASDTAAFRAALAKLRSYDFVNPDKVFLLGHSMGTAIVPIVAKDQKLAGIITYAASFRPWPESMVETMQRRWRFELIPEDQMKTKVAALQQFLDEFIAKKQPPEEILSSKPELREALGEGIVERGFVFNMPVQYGRELAAVPSANAWGAVNVPVLVLWGEADFIAGRSDSEKLAEAVNKARPGKATFTPLPEVDHSLAKAADQEESFLAGQGTFNPKFTETIIKWMGQQS